MLARIAFIIYLLPVFPATESVCHGSRTSYRAEFMGELVQNDKVLLGHVFATFPVLNFTHCFTECKIDCRCRSFNLPISGQGICELNNADNSSVLMKPRRGWRYHHLKGSEVRQGSDTCWEPYGNGCCATNPCHNGSVCTEVGHRGKPGFDCNCTAEGYLGQFCERKIHSCFDYLWHNKDAASGYYDVWDKSDNKYRVFCDMRPEKFEAWTLVMSYKLSQSSTFESRPFFVDYSSNVDNPTSDSYRLSLNTVQKIFHAMGDGKDLEWRATCGYSLEAGQTTNDDMIRSRLKTLDIMTFKTNRKSLVGYYPFTNTTNEEDKSGLGNHATFKGILYEDGPLGNPGGSVRLVGSTNSYIKLNDNSGDLDTRYSLTIMMQVYPYDKKEAPLLGWASGSYWGVYLWQFVGDVYFSIVSRFDSSSTITTRVPGLGSNMWNYVAVTYDYDSGYRSVYVNGTLLKRESSTKYQLRTDRSYDLTLGYIESDSRVYNGRVACLRIFSLALTEEEVKEEMEDWSCPLEPEPICHQLDYINIRGKECYNCNVWATQTNNQAFTINAHRGDQSNGCNFKSGSKVSNENIFGVYKAKDPGTHACAAGANVKTQYWFGGRL